jgi:NTP pyrophosphatase (non-canonical NTP hydrolase)
MAQAEQILDSLETEDELGDLLVAVASLARSRDWDAEAALRQAVRRRIDAIVEVERS